LNPTFVTHPIKEGVSLPNTIKLERRDTGIYYRGNEEIGALGE
jgi:hypothetical protein